MNSHTRFRSAHAAHPDWAVALEDCLLQLAEQGGRAGYVREPNLGFVYLTDALAPHAEDILSVLKARTGVSSWVGASGIGVCANGAEYMDEPALVLMLGQFAAGSFNVFSGMQRPPARNARNDSGQLAAWSALVHADPHTPDLPAMLEDMAYKLSSGRLFGGVASGRRHGPHHPVHIADQVLQGGLSGVVFAQGVALHVDLAHGCHRLPAAPAREVTRSDEQRIYELDGQRAFDVLLTDAGLNRGASPPPAIDLTLRNALHALARQGLFIGVDSPDAGTDTTSSVMRHVLALEPETGAIVTSADVTQGARLRFCTRDEAAARRDLTELCTRARTAADGAIAGAIYIACLARGGHLFGEQGEELRLIQSCLGAVPLVGFYANGEIFNRQLHQYSGVLMCFGGTGLTSRS